MPIRRRGQTLFDERQRIAGAIAGLRFAEQAMREQLKVNAAALGAKLYPDRAGHDFEFDRGWPCPNSPTAMCVYDLTDDPTMDTCLHCQEPHDRK
jgi:hypothetical protein